MVVSRMTADSHKERAASYLSSLMDDVIVVAAAKIMAASSLTVANWTTPARSVAGLWTISLGAAHVPASDVATLRAARGKTIERKG